MRNILGLGTIYIRSLYTGIHTTGQSADFNFDPFKMVFLASGVYIARVRNENHIATSLHVLLLNGLWRQRVVNNDTDELRALCTCVCLSAMQESVAGVGLREMGRLVRTRLAAPGSHVLQGADV